MTNESFIYHRLTQWRGEFRERFGGQFELPVTRSPYHECRSRYGGGRVLDVGAGVGKALRHEMGLNDEVYASLDPDPVGEFTYRSFDEIPAGEQFSMVVLNQVLEHLSVPQAFELMKNVAGVTQLDGQVVVSVPNARHAVNYWQDATHVVNWPVRDLYGLVREAGLHVEYIARYSKRFRLPRNPIKRYVMRVLMEEYGIDWARGIVLVARKTA
jgi:2-polyprenyl-3-methyl-5-hydroxy-6-metoxy-1,4-benzoquinol methylase